MTNLVYVTENPFRWNYCQTDVKVRDDFVLSAGLIFDRDDFPTDPEGNIQIDEDKLVAQECVRPLSEASSDEVDWHDLEEGDTVTITDSHGTTVRGKVTLFNQNSDRLVIRFSENPIVILNGYGVQGEKFTDLVKRTKPKPWETAPIGSVARVGFWRKLAIKGKNYWYDAQTSYKFSESDFLAGYVPLVEQKL